MALASSNGALNGGLALRIASSDRSPAAVNNTLLLLRLQRRQPALSVQRSLVLARCMKRTQQQKKSQSEALAGEAVSASRDRLDTSAAEMLHTWTGNGSDTKHEESSEKVGGSEAAGVVGTFLKDEEVKPEAEENLESQEEIGDIEKQFLHHDKLDSSNQPQEKESNTAATTIIGNGASGRNWRVRASGDGKAWNETQDWTEDIAAKLGSLEELVIKEDNGKSASDYNRRAGSPVVKKRISSARTLCKQLEDLYSGLDSSFMWDTTRVWELFQPTWNYEANSGDSYEYVGRANAKKVYESMLGMEAGQRMQVVGAAGSGKSTVVSTVSGYLIGCREKQVVYLCAERFIEDPESRLLDALLVACGRDDDGIGARLVSGLPTLRGLVDYCLEVPDGSFLFVVDNWDRLESERELEKVLLQASWDHMLVKVSSMNSKEWRSWCESTKADQEIKTVHFDGPYSSDELKTWLGQSGLTKDELQDLDRLTGGIPRLLRFYEETRGNEHAFLRKIEEPYTSKLLNRFIGKLESSEELQQALHLVVSGKCSPSLKAKVDLTCFYRDDDGLFRPLCPYFRNLAQSYIMDQQAQRLPLSRS